MQAVGGVGQLAGSVFQTIAEVHASKQRAKEFEWEAQNSEQTAAFDERQTRRENQFVMGHANAVTAASGVSLSSGSPLLMELDRVKQAEIQGLSIRRLGQMKASAMRYGGSLAKHKIPFQIAAGIGKGGSILGEMMGGMGGGENNLQSSTGGWGLSQSAMNGRGSGGYGSGASANKWFG